MDGEGDGPGALVSDRSVVGGRDARGLDRPARRARARARDRDRDARGGSPTVLGLGVLARETGNPRADRVRRRAPGRARDVRSGV